MVRRPAALSCASGPPAHRLPYWPLPAGYCPTATTPAFAACRSRRGWFGVAADVAGPRVAVGTGPSVETTEMDGGFGGDSEEGTGRFLEVRVVTKSQFGNMPASFAQSWEEHQPILLEKQMPFSCVDRSLLLHSPCSCLKVSCQMPCTPTQSPQRFFP